jgi:RNA polymerase sigma-70 factor (ECF subfamily)
MDADHELKERLVAGLDGAFELLVHAYQHRLFAFALSLCGNAADAEEIAQDAFVRTYRALRGYDADRIRELRLSAWLHQVTLNVLRNRVRRRRLRVVSLDSSPEPADRSLDPEAQVERQAQATALANLVSGLPDHHRNAVVLRCVQGMTYAEAAAVLGQPEGTVKANVHRGLLALRRRAGVLSEVS